MSAEPNVDSSVPAMVETAYEFLHEVIDPEIGVNIVDLGLVYGVAITEGAVEVRMTLTTPGCPLSGYMDDSIRYVLGQMPGVVAIRVELVWDPPWSPAMMTDEAKRQLGWLR